MEESKQEIQSLTNQELISKVDFLAKEERRIAVEVLRLLREIERRQLFAELGYPSLFAYCTKALRYSESAACRRIEAMRAMRNTSEVEAKLESGELSLSVVTQARATLRQFEKSARTKVEAEKRKDVMLSMCGKSKREAEKSLAIVFPAVLPSAPIVQRETVRGTTRVTLEFTEDEMKVFEEIRRLSGRPQNLKETLLRIAAKELTQLKKTRGETPVRRKQSPSPAVEKKEAVPSAIRSTKERRRTIPVATKRSVWEKSGGRCEYRNSRGERCEGRHTLEYDHVTPVSLGGLSNRDNLRVYCREHNVLSATRLLGSKLMAAYIPALR